MSLAPYIRIVAQGKGRARALTFEEAQAAMSLILSGNAAPEAVGALLMVLRLRGEADVEIGGFTAALRETTKAMLPTADLDWPCYSAGRTRGTPLFLLSAKLVAQAGYHVAIHGWNSHQATGVGVRQALEQASLLDDKLTYSPLENLSPAAFGVLKLRDTFGLRSCINTVLRMWNPSHAPVSVQGVFHPSYRGLQSRAAALLGDQNLTIIKGGGGEFERNPSKATEVYGLRDGSEIAMSAPAFLSETRRLHEPDRLVDVAALWAGEPHEEFVKMTVIGTAGLALWALGAAPSLDAADEMAAKLWRDRHMAERKSA